MDAISQCVIEVSPSCHVSRECTEQWPAVNVQSRISPTRGHAEKGPWKLDNVALWGSGVDQRTHDALIESAPAASVAGAEVAIVESLDVIGGYMFRLPPMKLRDRSSLYTLVCREATLTNAQLYH